MIAFFSFMLGFLITGGLFCLWLLVQDETTETGEINTLRSQLKELLGIVKDLNQVVQKLNKEQSDLVASRNDSEWRLENFKGYVYDEIANLKKRKK